MLRSLIVLLVCLPLAGCYYMQAAAGQWEVMRKREPLQELITDPETPPELAARLRLLEAARDFSIDVLGLPDNESYRSFTDLQRDYVVWNVFAAPEFSLSPKTWCYPIAGCVSYRGYFSKSKATRKAGQLREAGYDVAVGGVAAYSTLGRFADPILSTMMHWDDTALIALLFHELAHQVVYVKDDTAFNESFATAVEEFGVKRWLESQQQQSLFAAYVEKRAFEQRLTARVAVARDELGALYASDLDPADMRRRKAEVLATLLAALEQEAEASGQRYAGWIRDDVNNAHLVSTSLYEGYLPAFRVLAAACPDMPCFYAEAGKLAALDAAERLEALERLNRSAPDCCVGRDDGDLPGPSESGTSARDRRGGR